MGKSGGGGGGNAGNNPYTKALGRIANVTFDESSPMRRSITGTIGNVFGLDTSQWFPHTDAKGMPLKDGKGKKGQQGGTELYRTSGGGGQFYDAPVIEGLFSATPQERAAIEQQYGLARQNALNNGLRGSALGRGLTEIDISRAGHVANLVGAEKQRALSTALGVAYNTPQQSMSGLSGAAGQFTSGAMAQQQMAAQQAASQSAGLGGLLGGKKN